MGDPKLEDWGIKVDTLQDAVALAGRTSRFRIRMQFDDVERFDTLCYIAMKMGNVTVAVDEISMFTSPYWCPDNLKQIVRLGRHRNVRFIATTQRPPDIHSLILSQAKTWYLFQMHLPRDVDYLKKFVPNIERVMQLGTGEFILWQPEGKRTVKTTDQTPTEQSSSKS